MARRIQFMGTKLVESSSGLGWQRERASAASPGSGRYVTDMFGITYELEKRHRSPGDTPDTGWYLYSREVTYFFGEFCDIKLFDAIEEASDMILKADLRGEGYEKEET